MRVESMNHKWRIANAGSREGSATVRYSGEERGGLQKGGFHRTHPSRSLAGVVAYPNPLSGVLALAADPPQSPFATSFPRCSPRPRARELRDHATGRLSHRIRRCSTSTPSSRGFVYKTAPSQRRWLSRDPIDEWGGFNLCDRVGHPPGNSLELLGLRPYPNDFIGPLEPEGWPEDLRFDALPHFPVDLGQSMEAHGGGLSTRASLPGFRIATTLSIGRVDWGRCKCGNFKQCVSDLKKRTFDYFHSVAGNLGRHQHCCTYKNAGKLPRT